MKNTITALLSMLVAACSASTPTGTECTNGHCDVPSGTVKEQCTNSRVNAMDERRPHFTAKGVRWSCRDVNGVTADSDTSDDRGQEYCEYFSMLHTNGIPAVITNSEGPVFCDASTPCSQGVCDESIFSCVTSTTVDTSKPADILGKNLDSQAPTVTPLDPVLSAGQLEWLAQNPTQKVGDCVFTSWHEDIARPVASTEKIGGYSLTAMTPNSSEPLFRMEGSVNSNNAAQTLLQDCLTPGAASTKDGFMRACMMCGTKECVPFRKSDPSVCTMAMRIAECGCSINVKSGTSTRKLNLTKKADLAIAKDLFVPNARRGFTLGTWDGIDKLPTGCRYVRTGDSQNIKVGGVPFTDANADQTVVVCDLNANHITTATAKDPKEACRQTYGDEIVVHVRAPDPSVATLKCTSTKASCQGVPWDFGNL